MKFNLGKLLSFGFSALLTVSVTGAESDWITLIDGSNGLSNFNQVGNANWSAADGAIEASEGSGGAAFLVTQDSYSDFELRLEFWASEDANSGIFMRCQDPNSINDRNCYEANIYDQRPDPSYGTGGIVHIAPVAEPRPLAGGKWNTYEITFRGSRLQVVLNGETTVDVEDSLFASGVVALQWGRGTLRFRKLEIRPL